MNRRHFVLLSLACAASALALPAIGATTPRIGLVLKSSHNPFFREMADGARHYQHRFHNAFSLHIDGVATEIDAAGQEAIVRRLLAQHVAVLIVVPTDSTALLPLLARAIAAGILVVNLDNKFDDRVLARMGLNIPFVGPSNFRGAQSVGEALLPLMRAGDRSGIIEGPRGSINAKARSDGLGEAMRNGGIEVAGIRCGGWEEEGGYRAALKLMDAIPHLRAVLCGNDLMAIGAARAIAQRGRKGQILLTGYDGIPAIRPLLANGTVTVSADQYPNRQAEYALQLALSALRNHTRQGELPAIVQTPVTLLGHKG